VAGLVSSIVRSRRTDLPAIAQHAPGSTKRESRVKRFSRWVKNEERLIPFAFNVLEANVVVCA
jgi:hypothetical protein